MAAITAPDVTSPLVTSGVVTSPSVTERPGGGPPAGNTVDAAILAASPTYYWPLTETDNPPVAYAPSVGAAGNLLPGLSDGSGGLWGPARGLPIVRAWAMPRTSSAPLRASITGLDSTTVTTGCVSCFVFFTSLDNADVESTAISWAWANNPNLAVHIWADTAGRIIGFLGNTTGSSRWSRARSAPGTVQAMRWYHVAVVQRADGTGLKIYLDGVDVTADTQFAGFNMDADSWVNNLTESPQLSSNVYIASIVQDRIAAGLYAAPALWANSTPSDAQLLAITEARNVGADPADFWEYVDDYIISEDCYYLWHGMVESGSIQQPEIGFNDPNATYPNDTLGVSQSGLTLTNPAAFPRTNYEQGRSDFSGGDRFLGPSNDSRWQQGETQGTLIQWVKIDSISATRRTCYGLGQSSSRRLSCGVIGDTPFFEVFRNNQADLYRLQVSASAAQQYRVQVGQEYLFTVVQDGTGPRLWLNDIEIPASALDETQVGTITAATAWIGGLNNISASLFGWGARPGSTVENWNPNDVAFYAAGRFLLTQQQISNLYSAAINAPPS